MTDGEKILLAVLAGALVYAIFRTKNAGAASLPDAATLTNEMDSTVYGSFEGYGPTNLGD